MSDEKQPSSATEDGQEIKQAEELIENLTPEEKKKWSEKFLQLEYYKAISRTVLQIIKDFSKWTALAVSGIGTMIGGWYSLRKMTRQQRRELKKTETKDSSRETSIEGYAGKPSLSNARRTHERPVVSLQRDSSGVGSGVRRAKPTASPTPEMTESVEVPIRMEELQKVENLFADPMVVATIISIGVFASMTLKMAFNRFFGKKKHDTERKPL